MREEFEAWIRAEVERDERVVRIVREKNHYSGRDKHFLNTSWAAWQASRAALVIELPQEDGMDGHLWAPDVIAAIEAAGVKVKP